MTAAQFVFAFCAVVLVPSSSFIVSRCHLGESNTRPPKTKRVLWGLLFVCAVVAKVCFPNYPDAPTEPVAVSFTLPVLLGAALIAWRCTTQQRFRGTAICSIAAVYLAGLGLAYQFTVTPERKALPWNATVVDEYYWSDGILPDYDYSLTASIRQDQFEKYVRRLNLKPVPTETLEHFRSEEHLTDVYADEWEQGGVYAWMQNGLLHVHSFRM